MGVRRRLSGSSRLCRFGILRTAGLVRLLRDSSAGRNGLGRDSFLSGQRRDARLNGFFFAVGQRFGGKIGRDCRDGSCRFRFHNDTGSSRAQLRVYHRGDQHNQTGREHRNPVNLPDNRARPVGLSLFNILWRKLAQEFHKLQFFHSNPSFRRYFCSLLLIRDNVTFTLISVISKSAAISEIGEVCQ